jgi:hypothetical protein
MAWGKPDSGHTQMNTLELYRWAVQDPETHAVVFRTMYESLRPGRHAALLREDFAGTCADSVAWVALDPSRHAIAIDLDEQTLEWARRRADRLLGPLASAIGFIRGDVRVVGPPEVPRADIVSALNFSILYQHDPADLRSYLKHSVDRLAPAGIMVLNLFGGAAAVQPGITRHWITPTPRLSAEPPVPAFEYQWEVRSFDVAAHRLDARIHFAVSDPSTPGRTLDLRDAFTYDWRVWSVEELVDACADAGFSNVEVWRHTYDATKGASGIFLGRIDPASLATVDRWTAYVVACR